MTPLNYFLPGSILPTLVVGLILLLFVSWLVKFVSVHQALIRVAREVNLFTDMDFFANPDIPERSGDGSPSSDDDVATFQKWVTKNGADPDGIVARILGSVFLAGRNQTRLEIEGLVNAAEIEINKDTDFLKHLLTVFIILGLLGTLFGLASSFAQLSPLISTGSSLHSSAEVANGLSQLLIKLRSAFAPSIWGVMVTIIGLVLLTYVLLPISNSLAHKLRQVALGVWVPTLYKTSPQKWIQTLEESSLGLKASLDEIKSATELSYKEFGKDVVLLSEHLKGLDALLEGASKSSESFETMTKGLMDAVNAANSSASTMESTSKSLSEACTNVATKVPEIFVSRFDNLQQTVQKGVDLQIGNLSSLYEKANELVMGQSNKIDAIEEVYKSVAKDVTESFKNLVKINEMLNKDLPSSLGNIRKELADLGDPLKDSARKIEENISNFLHGSDQLPLEISKALIESTQPLFTKYEGLIKAINAAGLSEANQHLSRIADRLEMVVKRRPRRNHTFSFFNILRNKRSVGDDHKRGTVA